MLRSMTGFGRGTHRVGATEATVEVRSVNGRFAEVSVRGPRSLNAFDPAIQVRCKDVLVRGNVTVNLTLQRVAADAGYQVDGKRAKAIARMMEDVRNAAGIPADVSPITLDLLLRYPEVLTAPETDPQTEQSEAWAVVEPALEAALSGLDAMRLKEGTALANDLARRVLLIEEHLEAIEDRAPERVSEAQNKLRGRLGELLTDERLNPDRLETEIALLADKLDVTEECVRLRSHLAQFRDAFNEEEAVGRRLNFLAQEFNREINTIGSKANDSEMAQRVIRMKEELEKVREQVQNVV
ncbi:MAG: YicC family protein [Bacteroidetes bacterium]|nr:YicC family protein [Bacteroidota bacterium]